MSFKCVPFKRVVCHISAIVLFVFEGELSHCNSGLDNMWHVMACPTRIWVCQTCIYQVENGVLRSCECPNRGLMAFSANSLTSSPFN